MTIFITAALNPENLFVLSSSSSQSSDSSKKQKVEVKAATGNGQRHTGGQQQAWSKEFKFWDVCLYNLWSWQCVLLFRTGGRSRRRIEGSWPTNSPRADPKDPPSSLGSRWLQSRRVSPSVSSRVCRRFTGTLGVLRQQRLWQQLWQRR